MLTVCNRLRTANKSLYHRDCADKQQYCPCKGNRKITGRIRYTTTPYKKETALLMLKAAHFFAFSRSLVPRLHEIRLEPPIPNKFAIPISMTKGGIASVAAVI